MRLSVSADSIQVEFVITAKLNGAAQVYAVFASPNTTALTETLGVVVNNVTKPEVQIVYPPPSPPAQPPPCSPPTAPGAAAWAIWAQQQADIAKAKLQSDMRTALYQLKYNASGSMVELDISAGVLDAAFLKEFLYFSPATSASEVILTGKGAEPFNPLANIITPFSGSGRRMAVAEGGTTFSNLPVTVLGGIQSPAVQLHKIRFEKCENEPAILIHDLGKLIVQDCIFDRNPGAAIRLLSGQLDVSYSSFTNNGVATARGGALQLLGGVAKIFNSLLRDNNASEGGAIFIEGADVALGNRTILLRNRADLGSVPINTANFGKYSQDAGTNPSTPNYVASELHGNSIYSTNGTLRYVLPAPLGRWVGPTRESELFPLGLVGTESVSVVIQASQVESYNPLDRRRPDKRLQLSPDFRIDEDFPFHCAPGFFRELDTPEAQDGPWCESTCRQGSWCPAGTITPLPCFKASYCPEGSRYPKPCLPGTWTNRTDLAAAHDCDQCPIGHYCPLNTSAPIPCLIGTFAPTVGLADCQLCPVGTFTDIVGQWNCSRCIDGVYCPLGTTIEPCFPGEYRNLETGACIKAPLGNFASLGATAPTLCPAGAHADVIGLQECKQCPAGKYFPGSGAVVCTPCPIGEFCWEGSTAGTACVAGTVRLTVGARFQADCEPAHLGHYGQRGVNVPCPMGYYQDQLGTDSEIDCIRCPEYATTFDIGRPSIYDCGCEEGFVEDRDVCEGGVERCCVCEKGDGIVSAGGSDVCEKCVLGKYKDRRGNVKCTDCKTEEWITAQMGSDKADDCVCRIGYYKAPSLNESMLASGLSQTASYGLNYADAYDEWARLTVETLQYELNGEISYDCFLCEGTWDAGVLDATNCTYIGVDIINLPILAGYYRQQNTSRIVRECINPGPCLGGANWDTQCYYSHFGPYCGSCKKGYISGSPDELCGECLGDEGVTMVAYIVPFILIICIVGGLYAKCSAMTKRLLLERLPMTVEVASGEDPADVWAVALSDASVQLGKDWPRTYGVLNSVQEHFKTFSPRFKILVSLMQVMNGLGTVFALRWPPYFKALLRLIGTITFIDVDIPKLMPMGCLFPINFFSSLFSKTAVPFIIIVGLFATSAIANKYCSGKDVSEWDQDQDGEIDRDEFMSAQPAGKFVGDMCASTGFFLIFLLYPSASVTIFQFFVCYSFHFEGDTGYNFLLKVGACHVAQSFATLKCSLKPFRTR